MAGIKTLHLSDFQDIQTVDSKHLIAKYQTSRRSPIKKYELSLINLANCADYLSKWKSLKHPGIIPIKYLILPENGKSSSKKAYICTEYQEGETLENWLKENRDKVSKIDLSKIVRGVVEALDYMHKQQLAHGNLKILNIVIRKYSNAPILKDFWQVKKKKPEIIEDAKSLRLICAEIISPLNIKSRDDILKHRNSLTIAEQRFLQNAFSYEGLSWYYYDSYITGKHEYCTICFRFFAIENVISCSDSHSVCKECLDGMIRNYTSLGYFDWLNNNEGKVMCPSVSSISIRCTNFYDEKMILKQVSGATVRLFKDFQKKCKAEHMEMKGLFEEKKKISTTFEGKVEDAVHQVEEMLNLKCPRCHKAFIDFSGCTHLTCSLCKCKFCAICLGVYVNNEYQHAECCSSKANFTTEQKKRASLNIEQQLNSIRSTKIRNEVKKRISPLLDEHNLGIQQVQKKIRII